MSEPNAPLAEQLPAAHVHHGVGHVAPAGVLVAVFVALIALTALTVAATWFDLGGLNLLVALGIATVKAALVAAYFMHLRYDHPFNTLVLVVALLFLGLFLWLTLLDTQMYQPELIRYQEELK